MELPRRIRVGLYEVAIERQGPNDHHRGRYQFSGAEPVIELCGQAGVYEAEVLVHELLHVVAHKVGSDGAGKDEPWVQLFANGLCEVLRDNPAFAAWLIEQLGIGPAVAGMLRREQGLPNGAYQGETHAQRIVGGDRGESGCGCA